MKPVLVIPHYNHHLQFAKIFPRLKQLNLPMIVVDDGSEDDSRQAVRAMLGDQMTLLAHTENQGKGGAMITGLRAALAAGYSHAVQVDADGQHTIEDIPELLAASGRQPDAIISARPLFDDSIPRARQVGRLITDFWVSVETLSRRVKESMCGFRIYPLPAVVELLDRHRFGPRMQFDIEILVYATWARIPLHYVPSAVIYPEDGKSHFHYWRDNRDISLMHIKLVLGMLLRLPLILGGRLKAVVAR
jgi:glycosyltransferase involved in cell wall biosynthesis